MPSVVKLSRDNVNVQVNASAWKCPFELCFACISVARGRKRTFFAKSSLRVRQLHLEKNVCSYKSIYLEMYTKTRLTVNLAGTLR